MGEAKLRGTTKEDRYKQTLMYNLILNKQSEPEEKITNNHIYHSHRGVAKPVNKKEYLKLPRCQRR